MCECVEMGKPTNVTIRIDKDVVKEAKEAGLNLSKISEIALKDATRRLKGTEHPREDGKKPKGVLHGGPGGTRTLDHRLVKAIS